MVNNRGSVRQSMPMPKHPEKYKLAIQHMSESHKGKTPWNKGKQCDCSHLTPYQFKKGHKIRQGIPHTEESKNRMSLTRRGRKLSEEHKQKLGDAHRGKPKSLEWRKKISISNIGKHSHPAWNKGKKMSEESRKKLSESCKGRPSAFKGKHHTLEAKEIFRLSHLGRKQSVETIRKRMEKVEKLPRSTTSIERKMHQLLDSLHVKYRKHFPIYHPKMGLHQVDIMFVDHEDNSKIALECDGDYFHGCPQHNPDSKFRKQAIKRDRLIDKCLIELGIKVIRLWECEINSGKIPIEVYS